jgi:hypothetical protein
VKRHGSFTSGCKEGSKKTEEQKEVTISAAMNDGKRPSPLRTGVGFFYCEGRKPEAAAGQLYLIFT